jgi:hypothetical protein
MRPVTPVCRCDCKGVPGNRSGNKKKVLFFLFILFDVHQHKKSSVEFDEYLVNNNKALQNLIYKFTVYIKIRGFKK